MKNKIYGRVDGVRLHGENKVENKNRGGQSGGSLQHQIREDQAQKNDIFLDHQGHLNVSRH